MPVLHSCSIVNAHQLWKPCREEPHAWSIALCMSHEVGGWKLRWHSMLRAATKINGIRQHTYMPAKVVAEFFRFGSVSSLMPFPAVSPLRICDALAPWLPLFKSVRFSSLKLMWPKAAFDVDQRGGGHAVRNRHGCRGTCSKALTNGRSSARNEGIQSSAWRAEQIRWRNWR